MKILFLTLLVVGAAMAIMAVGLVFRGRCFGGSCSGDGVIGPDGEVITCDTCPKREELEAKAAAAKQGQDSVRPVA